MNGENGFERFIWKERNRFFEKLTYLFLHFRVYIDSLCVHLRFAEQYMFKGVNLQEYADAVF